MADKISFPYTDHFEFFYGTNVLLLLLFYYDSITRFSGGAW